MEDLLSTLLFRREAINMRIINIRTQIHELSAEIEFLVERSIAADKRIEDMRREENLKRAGSEVVHGY